MRARGGIVATLGVLVVSTVLLGTARGEASAAPATPPTTAPSSNQGGSKTGWQNNNGNTVTVGAQNGSSSSGSSGSSGSSSGSRGGPSSCQWVLQALQGPNDPSTGGYSDGPDGQVLVSGTTAGAWYLEVCPGAPSLLFFVPAGSAAAAVVSPRQLADQARAQLVAPAPQVEMSPPSTSDPPGTPLSLAHWQYVNLPDWVWLGSSQWVTLHATAAVPGVSVTATAVPAQLVLGYQDGPEGTKVVTCNGPGTPYSAALAESEDPAQPVQAASPTCGWTWDYSSSVSPDEHFEVTAYVVYDLSWTVSGAAGGGALPALDSATSTYQVVVGEIESLNTNGA